MYERNKWFKSIRQYKSRIAIKNLVYFKYRSRCDKGVKLFLSLCMKFKYLIPNLLNSSIKPVCTELDLPQGCVRVSLVCQPCTGRRVSLVPGVVSARACSVRRPAPTPLCPAVCRYVLWWFYCRTTHFRPEIVVYVQQGPGFRLLMNENTDGLYVDNIEPVEGLPGDPGDLRQVWYWSL